MTNCTQSPTIRAVKTSRDPQWQQEVGQRLVISRAALGVRAVQLANYLHISAQRLSNYERGSRPLDLDVAVRLCNRYGLTLDWIYRGQIAGLPTMLADRIEAVMVPSDARRH